MQNPAKKHERQQPAELDREMAVQMIRKAVGPKLDSLSQAAKEVKEANRLLELAQWAGDSQAEQALRDALAVLTAATVRPS